MSLSESIPAWETSGDLQSWSVISVDTGNGCPAKECLTKGLFGEVEGYDVMLCDGNTVWREKIGAQEVLRRHKGLNPNVEVSMDVLLSTLSSHLESQQPHATYKLTPSLTTPTTDMPPDLVTLHIQTSLASFPLQWRFTLDRCLHTNELSTHLVTPLLTMVGELMRRQQQLYTLLSRKDKEIQDYKDQGHKVTRRYLETGMFVPEAFETDMSSSLLFEESVEQDIQVFCNPTCQQLYSDIGRIRKKLRDKTDPGTGGSGVNDGVGDTVSAGDSALPSSSMAAGNESPPIGGAKRSAPQEVPSKDSELSRREQLEKKLEESKNKPKKKKRKLM